MAIRWNFEIQRAYDDKTGRFVAHSRAMQSSIFREEWAELEELAEVTGRREKFLREEGVFEIPYIRVGEYDDPGQIFDIYLEVYEIDPADIDESP